MRNALATSRSGSPRFEPLEPRLLLDGALETPAEAFAYDIAGTFGSSRMPASVVGGQAFRGSVNVLLTNEGTSRLPRGQRVTAELVAVRASDGAESVLAQRTMSVSYLSPGLSRSLRLSTNVREGLAVGQYDVIARLSPVGSLPGENADNNTVELDGDGNTLGITSADPFVDLVASFGSVRGPTSVTSGDGTTSTAPIMIQNDGNVSLSRPQRIDVSIYARSGGTDTLVYSYQGYRVSNLRAGTARRMNGRFSLPPGLAAGTYQLITVVDDGDVLAESDETNNEAAAATSIDVARGYVDLTGTVTASSLPTSALSGESFRGSVSVAIANDGNVSLPRGQRALVQLVAIRTSDSAETVLAQRTMSVSGLQAGRPRMARLNVFQRSGLPLGEYRLEARLTTPDDLAEEDLANNTVVVAEDFSVGEASVDLSGVFASSTLPTAAWENASVSGSVGVRVTNGGNMALPRGQQVHIQLVAVRASDSAETVLGQSTASVSNLGAGHTKTVNVAASLPAGLGEGEYSVEARLTTPNDLVESGTTNNTVQVDLDGDPVGLMVTEQTGPPAQGRTIYNGSQYLVTFDGAQSVGAAGGVDLVGGTITIRNKTGDSGYDASAFDGIAFGYTGISGRLHQQYSESLAVSTPTADSTAFATEVDTHFSANRSDMLTVIAPTETVGTAASSEPSDATAPLDQFAITSYGSNLTGVFAVNATPVMNLAYIVASRGSSVRMDFFISGTAGGEHILASFGVS